MESILNSLYDLKVQSVIIEGGTKTIKNFLDNDLWDSIRVFKGNTDLVKGIKSPGIDFIDFKKTPDVSNSLSRPSVVLSPVLITMSAE